MIKRALCFISFIFICGISHASDDCVSFKITPKITVSTPPWTKHVVQPLQPMDLWHGNVIATLVDNYDIVADITSIEDGFCVGLKQVNAEIGYSEFQVNIDIRHIPNTCSYDAVLAHEDQHIREYLSVIEDFNSDLHKSIYVSADSVMPIFVSEKSDIENAITQLNEKLQSHPDLILIKQKIQSAQEIRNKRIDLNNTGEQLRKCFD